ncbi:MAG: tetratricopeptide repeat protein [Proteobacteria bacterium]|nr:tetratricopeptide repeat protein [Pseudomonadota bacterium]
MLINLGRKLFGLGQPSDAAACYRRAIARKPDYVSAHLGLGLALRALDRDSEAEAAYRRALELDPNNQIALSHLADTLNNLGKTEEAVKQFRRAIEIRPDLPEPYNNLGTTLDKLGDFREAETCYRRAIALRPDLAEARSNLALMLLSTGRLAEGWQDYEWRWRSKDGPKRRRDFGKPEWTGQPLAAGSLHLWGEQGVGDQVLHASRLPDARFRAPRCVLECEPRLVPLFTRSFPEVEVIARADPPSARAIDSNIAAHLALGSLPRLLVSDLDAITPHDGYLTADAIRSGSLRARYRALGRGPIVGISWRSNRKDLLRWKSSALLDWAPILTVPGVVFVNLQYGDCAADLAAVREKLGISVYNDAEIDSLKDLDGFAAQVAAMDLVISVSNTTVHFAGALNIPVWTLLSAGLGLLWYWFRDREDSPWYPSMRLLRQQHLGDWGDVIARAAVELRAKAARS